MAKDEYLLRAAARWERPVLRLYGWHPMTLSVGRNQRVEEEIDLAACRREGVAVVRRSTGGWAVLHGTDLTYAVAAPASAGFGGTIMEAYRSLAEVFVRLFAELGFRPEVQSYGGRERARRASPICFATPSAYELLIGGKKLVGSAQRRRPDGFLQHGSIPLRRQNELLARLFRGATAETIEAAMTDLETLDLWRRLTPAEFQGKLLDAFERVFRAEWCEMPWTEEDERAVGSLEERYRPIGEEDRSTIPARAV